jgi:diaminopimelate decarboxylase
MDYFNYHGSKLYAESIAVSDLAAKYGTPLYLYSRKTIERHWHAFNDCLEEHPHTICYAVKANSNIGLLNLLARLGSGFDVVSAGELNRVVKAGGDIKKTVFSGVGKTSEELRLALNLNIGCINVESEAELYRLQKLSAEMGKIAPVSLRINPNIDAKTHPYISTGLKDNKFGIELEHALRLYQDHSSFSNVIFIGIDCHIGSQITELSPFIQALDKLIELADFLKEQGLNIKHLDLGGGLGVKYLQEMPPNPAELAKVVRKKIANRPYHIILEPGRAIMANAGILVTRTEYLKPHHDKHFAIVDAAMNDLLRPALYDSYQHIIPVNDHKDAPLHRYDIVGPVCESGDFLGKNRSLRLNPNDLLAIRGAGAYGASMGSNYNSRPRPAEILIDNDKAYVIRARESFEQLINNEQMIP